MSGHQASLVGKAAAGDGDALRILLERHGLRVRGRLGRQIHPRWQSVLEADDVMQVTYLEAFLRIGRLRARTEAGFFAWLTRIAERNLQDAIRELRRRKRPQPQRRVAVAAGHDSHASLLESLTSISTTPSRAAAQAERAEMLEQALSHLPQDYAVVVKLYDLEELPAHEVATRMSRSSGAVYMLRARAHDFLKDIVGPASQFYSDTA